jgi:hypothetical protein
MPPKSTIIKANTTLQKMVNCFLVITKHFILIPPVKQVYEGEPVSYAK